MKRGIPYKDLRPYFDLFEKEVIKRDEESQRRAEHLWEIIKNNLPIDQIIRFESAWTFFTVGGLNFRMDEVEFIDAVAHLKPYYCEHYPETITVSWLSA